MKITRLISPEKPVLTQDNVKEYAAILKTLPRLPFYRNVDDISLINPFPTINNGQIR